MVGVKDGTEITYPDDGVSFPGTDTAVPMGYGSGRFCVESRDKSPL